jgi:hypothetical protein
VRKSKDSEELKGLLHFPGFTGGGKGNQISHPFHLVLEFIPALAGSAP